ncbi:MAG: hypothetical protein ACQGVC_17135 [Myxococcota bacterium]
MLAFDGRIAVVLPGFGETEVGSGAGVAVVDALNPTRVRILGAAVAGTATVPVTDPAAAPVSALRFAASLVPGTLSIDPHAAPFGEPAVTGPFALPGTLQVCLLAAPLPPCVGGFQLPMTASSGGAGVGVGGLLTFGGSATVRISLYGAPFTLATASARGTTPGGAPFTFLSSGSIGGPLLFTSSAGQTGGFLSVVTPLRTRAAGVPGASGLPGFLRLELVFAPEPGPALLLGAGGAALLALERTRSRKGRRR